MNSVLVGIVVIPGFIALLLLAVFTFLHRQTRDRYFQTWQLGWAAYCVHYVCLAVNFYVHRTAPVTWLGKFSFAFAAWCVLRSTRLVRKRDALAWFDYALLAGAALWSAAATLWGARESGPVFYTLGGVRLPFVEIESAIAVLLVIAAYRFLRLAEKRNSTGFRLLFVALGFWAGLLLLVPLHGLMIGTLANIGHFLGPVPQMLLGIAQVVVLFERERSNMQENVLAFAMLEADSTRLLSAAEIAPGMLKLLERLLRVLELERGAFIAAEEWRSALPCVQKGFSQNFLNELDQDRVAAYLQELAERRGGVRTLRDLDEPSLLPQEHGPAFERLRVRLRSEAVQGVTIANLETRERCFGALVLPNHRSMGAAQLRLLVGLSMQMALTLENYVLMQGARRRTKEYELLTHVGQVISSHLDPDAVLLSFQRELGQLFDTSNMYVAFVEGNTVRFELEVLNNILQPKRSRPVSNMFTEHVVRTGKPLLITSDLEKVRAQLGCGRPPEPAKSLAMVPIVMHGKPVGVMAALNHEREFMYSARDIEVLTTAADQVAVAMENARLFLEEQRRARYLAFLNNVSKTAISSQDAESMLREIVAEIQQNFRFDHIGIGILDYGTKEIEFKADAGVSGSIGGRRVPLGAGLVGRVARTGEMALVTDTLAETTGALLPGARSVLCLPVTYGDSLLGVLNIESLHRDAFAQPEVLILRTLADLLATALHNAFVYQKLQQQAITDGLTGIKTRRFFLEALQSEWKRASRTGRSFSVVLMDLDKLKAVNDSMGHLEGDLVLARVGRLLEQKCRQSNVVARYGGDEFVILMPETALEQAQTLSERLRQWVASDPMLSEHHISGSFGVASFPLHGATAEEVLRVADAGMYASKRAGGNRVATVEEFGDTAASHRQLVAAFVEGFLQREHYGPELAEELVQRLRKLAAGVHDVDAAEVLSDAVLMLARAAEGREMHASGHGELAAKIAETIARGLDLTTEEIRDIVFAARVHDVGKILIPERILNKNAPLTADEHYLLRMHASIGGDIANAIPGGARVAQAVRHHHERFDGQGYPDKLQGEQIPLAARILAVAEVYSNITIDRPYAPAFSRAEAIRELEAAGGTQLDGMLVRVLLHALKSERAVAQGL